MEPWLQRTARLLGEGPVSFLQNATVAIIGLGGVGGSAAEAICRTGVGTIILVDSDTVDPSNCNRQLLATSETVGMDKTQAASQRLKAINPNVRLICKKEFYLPDNCDFLFDEKPDLILDAIDTVTSKLHLAQTCYQKDIPLVSCLGTGNRVDPSQLRWGDISETAGCGCPLARVIRRELRKRGVPRQTVIYSAEEARKVLASDSEGEHGRHSPASCAFVPPAAGCLLASAGVRLLLKKHGMEL